MVVKLESDYRSCVGLMLINEKKKFFTAQRLDFTSTAWQMPQGGINEGEDPLEAAFRELNEETSIDRGDIQLLATSKEWVKYDLPKTLIPFLWDGKYKGQKQKWFLFRFFGNESNINIHTQNPEFSRWRWSNKKQLVDSIVSFKRPVYQTILEEFSAYLN